MRDIKSGVGIAMAVWLAAAAFSHFYFAGTGWLDPLRQRSLHLGLFLPLIFLLYPATKSSPRNRPSIPDLILAVLAILPSAYIYASVDTLYLRSEYLEPVTTTQFVLGTILILLILEGLRRAVTPILAVLTAIMILYLFVADLLPGIWNYRDMSTAQIVETMFLINGRGIYGPLMGISSNIVSIFIIFGAFVQISGTGRLFSNFGTVVAGRYAGGPAKVAVISSGLFGMMSGSSVSNVATTGSITIPMMKRLGYRSSFAGGVEAAASVGGAIMPPVMGSAAFVMAEITNIPYSTIIVAAALGAALYYFTILLIVHLEAKRLGLAGLDASLIPAWRVVAADAHLIVPIALLIMLLMMGFSPAFSAFWSIIAVTAFSWLKKDTRVTPMKAFEGFARAGGLIAVLALAVGAAGIIIAGLTTTGLVLSFGAIVNGVAGSNLAIAAILVMFVCLLLGMGVPTTPAYIITAVIGAPILVEMGPALLSVHLFVFYFAILADATPPVSVASYTAAAIAKAHPLSTGFQAWRMALGGFVVAFSYLYEPAIMFQGPLIDTVFVVVKNAAALTLLSIGFIGYARQPISWWLRVVSLAAGVAIAFSYNFETSGRALAGIAIVALLLVLPGYMRPVRSVPAPNIQDGERL